MVGPYGARSSSSSRRSLPSSRASSSRRPPDFAAMLNAYLDRLPLAGARRVLDLGCGTGVAARDVGRPSSPAGSSASISSPHMVAAARRLAHEQGLAERISFQIGDSEALEERMPRSTS